MSFLPYFMFLHIMGLFGSYLTLRYRSAILFLRQNKNDLVTAGTKYVLKKIYVLTQKLCVS